MNLNAPTFPQQLERQTPVDRRSMTTNVAPVLLRPLLQEARRVGVDVPSLCQGLGFEPHDLDQPGFMVSHFEACTVVRRALAAIDNPSLGLELGARSNIVNRGALGLGVLASSTLREAMRLGQRYPASAGHLLEVQDRDEDQGNVLTASPMFGNHDIAPFLVDYLFASSVRVRRTVTSASYAPIAIELIRSRPAYADRYEEVLGCPVRFDCSHNRMISDIEILDRPLPSADERSFRLATDLLERESAAAAGATPVGLSVERSIRRALPKPPTPAEIASGLNISERSLRRRLQDSGLSYQQILDEGRKSRALELIVNSRMPLTQVALESGFSDLRTFRRAFKRWTGRTPSEMKRA